MVSASDNDADMVTGILLFRTAPRFEALYHILETSLKFLPAIIEIEKNYLYNNYRYLLELEENAMPLLVINKLGPIQHCELSINRYTILTGYQASGKSTIAKAVYFFRTLKEDIYQMLLRREYMYSDFNEEKQRLTSEFESLVRNKFLNTFGTSYSMDKGMFLSYQYSENVSITIRLEDDKDFLSPNYVWVAYDDPIRSFFKELRLPKSQEQLKQELAVLFSDTYETVYIPAGRSVLTVLGSQFNYFYSTMDDSQKRLLDSCTRDYLERVMRLRPQFSNGLEGLLEGKKCTAAEKKMFQEVFTLTNKILKGKYTVSGGEERIWVDTEHYVKINFASSGQQEIVWILNLLIYYLVIQKQILFIIEEPESNLFPEAQKWVVELISLVTKAGNAVILTTHSPYVLGTVNNLLYAEEVGRLSLEKTGFIVSKCKWINHDECTALFVQDGTAVDCMDPELHQIDNSLLDQISHSINREYDELFDIERQAKE